jgi:hypothetical protein
MTPIQQLMLGVGAKKKTYLDDVFSTQVYAGTGSARSINNGIDLAGEGGMVWNKIRSEAYNHALFDTVRSNGSTHNLRSNSNNEVYNYGNTGFTSWNNNGYSLGSDTVGEVNFNNQTYASWTFRKAPGFFDVVTWTGNGTARTIAHSLGSVPGCILIKCTTSAFNWMVYHRGSNNGVNPAEYGLRLNDNIAQVDNTAYFNDTLPTSTHFTIGTNAQVNSSGSTYVAYVFAGGESTAATAHSIELDGTNDGIKTSTSSDYDFGTGDFTVEFWIKFHTVTATQQTADHRTSAGQTAWCNYLDNNREYKFWMSSDRITGKKLDKEQWYHIATVRHSGTTTLYIDGISQGTYADTNDYSNQRLIFGLHGPDEASFDVDGEYSNIRIVKGTAVYTSSFRPPTAPLTNITNTKFLGANSSSVTGTTVGTAVALGDPTASTDSPFDDPAGFVFGENGDQGISKCGSYVGNGSATGPEIYLGFEPSWILHKSSSVDGTAWHVFDCMRGVVTGGNDAILVPNTTAAEASDSIIDITSTGFKITTSAGGLNQSNGEYIYMAIRRPDGYVGKPADAGTGVFAMDTGASQLPVFDSGFPVDFALMKVTNSSQNWYPGARLIQGKFLEANTTSAEGNNTEWVFDFNDGWNSDNSSFNNSNYQSWMWKRHAGFDVVCDVGQSAGKDINHSLNAVPEMIWRKNRDNNSTAQGKWIVYHKDFPTSGSNLGYAYLNLSNAAGTYGSYWTQTPTSTVFSVGNDSDINYTDQNHISFLFSSVGGISKVGSYTGDDSDDGSHVIDVGFTPRFLIIKRSDGSADWKVFDTTNGFPTSGTSNYLELNTTDARYSGSGITVTQTTNGFKLWSPGSPYNANNAKYIYYAHA